MDYGKRNQSNDCEESKGRGKGVPENICEYCSVRDTDRCPTCGEGVAFGCRNFVQLPIVYNKGGESTKCGNCRFLFLKPKSERDDKSFVNCGRCPSNVIRETPSPNCPYFRRLRKQEVFKRRARQAKRMNYGQRQNQGGRRNYNDGYRGYSSDNRGYSSDNRGYSSDNRGYGHQDNGRYRKERY